MSVSISKHKVVLRRFDDKINDADRFVQFSYIEEETGVLRESFDMAMSCYRDLGRPEEITVTVELGNKLADEYIPEALIRDTATAIQREDRK